LVENWEGKKPLRDVDLHGGIILKCILKNYDVRVC
jgi:hypothetical protein